MAFLLFFLAFSDQPRLLVVSIDGAADWVLDAYIEEGVLSKTGAFQQMTKKGFRAEALLPVHVSSTASSHAALFTGALPSQSGIVANRFLDRSKNFKAHSGFSTPYQAETIFNSLTENQIQVVCAPAVGIDGLSAKRDCTETFPYPARLANPFTQNFKLPESAEWQAVDRPLRFKTIPGDSIPFRMEVHTQDQKFRLIWQDQSDPFFSAELGKLVQMPMVLAGFRTSPWVRLKRIKDEYQLYVGICGYFPTQDRPFVKEILDKFGPWPGEADHRNFHLGIIDFDTWYKQSQWQNQYLFDINSYLLARKNWQVHFTYLNLVDDVQHHFLLGDNRQLMHREGEKKRNSYGQRVLNAYRQVDAWLARYLEIVGPDTNVLIISDHGMVPTHSIAFLKPFLQRQGYQVEGQKAEVKLVTVGPSSHIYLTKKGITKEDVTKLKDVLNRFKDPLTLEPIAEVIADFEEMKSLGLAHEDRAGTVFVSARPGWGFSAKMPPNGDLILQNAYEKSALAKMYDETTVNFLLKGGLNEMGQSIHGHLNHNRQVQAICFGLGPNFGLGEIGVLESAQITPTIAKLLTVSLPSHAGGKPFID